MKDKFLLFVRENPLLFSLLASSVLVGISWLVAEIVNKVEAGLSKAGESKGIPEPVLVALVFAAIVFGCVQVLIRDGLLR